MLFFKLQGDILALSETRLTQCGQHEAQKIFDEHGYSVVFGRPQPEQRTIMEAKAGGVAIAARPGIDIQRTSVLCESEQRLIDSGRYVRAVAAYGNGDKVIHIMSMYGFLGLMVILSACKLMRSC